MQHPTIGVPSGATRGIVRAATTEAAGLALKSLHPVDLEVEAALDAAYGAGSWYLYWDEDLRGRPIRGTITLAYGNKTLVVG